MEPIYTKEWKVEAIHVDRFDMLKPSALLHMVQEAAGEHCQLLHVSWQELNEKNLFWAILRHRVQITRLPKKGETITLETWPMPTTRTAFPRSVIAFDEERQELFRTVGLWVLMDPHTRSMVLPKKSGVDVPGVIRGNELAVPGGLIPGTLQDRQLRKVCFTDLDINGHMNNARYLDWIQDLLPSGFHSGNAIKDMTLCYLAETREGDLLETQWALSKDGKLQVDIFRRDQENTHRVFSAHIDY